MRGAFVLGFHRLVVRRRLRREQVQSAEQNEPRRVRGHPAARQRRRPHCSGWRWKGWVHYGDIPSIMARKACKQNWEYSAAAAETIRTNPTVSTPGVVLFDRMLRIYVMNWKLPEFWKQPPRDEQVACLGCTVKDPVDRGPIGVSRAILTGRSRQGHS